MVDDENNFFLADLELFNVPLWDGKGNCDSVKVELSINDNGICKIKAVVNDEKESETEFAIKSTDGVLTKEEIKKLSKEMAEWFDDETKQAFIKVIEQNTN